MEESPASDSTEITRWLVDNHDRQLIRATLDLSPAQRLEELTIAEEFFGGAVRRT